MTENEMAMAMPRVPHIYGDVSVKYAAVSILEPLPVINMTNPVMTEPGEKVLEEKVLEEDLDHISIFQCTIKTSPTHDADEKQVRQHQESER